MSSVEEVEAAARCSDPTEKILRLLRCRALFERNPVIEERAREIQVHFQRTLRAIQSGNVSKSADPIVGAIVSQMFTDQIDPAKRDEILKTWLDLCEDDESFFGWLALFWWG